ncbi:MAG: AIR synthase-related protein [Deferribacterota bacterium]|nr:AIR synthase-related protein [Deferribacterota bacterium]
MEEGKLSYNILEKIIKTYSVQDASMVKGPGIGIDCSVFDNGRNYLVVTSDPVTYIASGKYCVNVNVNDIASMGAEPWFFLSSIVLPKGYSQKQLEVIMAEIKSECEKYNINFGGGHTEINSVVNNPVIAGFMVGYCDKDDLRGSFNAKDGDIVIITKGVSIEGTSIIAEIKKNEVLEKFGSKFLKSVVELKNKLSVLEEARIARKYANAMHDITEGGLVNGLYEIAIASNVSIDLESLPIIDVSKILCDEYNIDPLGLITAGTLVITTSNKSLKDLLDENGVDAFEIGRVVSDAKKEVRYKGKVLEMFERDEIVKLFQ